MRVPASRLLVFGVPLLFSACATIAPPQPPSLNLPKPPADVRASRKGDRVTLTWTVPSKTTDRQTIRAVGPTQVCRDLIPKLAECGKAVGQAPASSGATGNSSTQRATATYTDSLNSAIESDAPSAFATYAVEVLNREGRGAGPSNQVRVSLARTLPPPNNFQARVTSQGVLLSWSSETAPENPPQSIHYAVRVYRRAEVSQQQRLVGEVPAGGEQSLTDSDIEWEKTYDYRAETVTVIEEANKPLVQVEGDDTPEVRVFADDVFPPAVPSGLQAVFSGPGQKPFIDLVWAPVTDFDLAGYNVYRNEEGTSPTKLNGEPLKSPAYRDANVVSQKKYSYAVSAVDMRGNESARSDQASELVP